MNKVEQEAVRLDDADLDGIQGAGGNGYWDHSPKNNSQWVTADSRSDVRRRDDGAFVRWDRGSNAEVAAQKLRKVF